MGRKTTIALSQYLRLVSNGYDGDVVRKWTRARARTEIEKKNLSRHASAPEGERQSKSCPLPCRITVADAIAAGLDEKSAAHLVSASSKYGSGRAMLAAKELSKVERDHVRDLCLDVIKVVGLGPVDRVLLNHRIRQVIRALLTGQNPSARLSDCLCRLFATDGFAARALQALEKDIQRRNKSSSDRRLGSMQKASAMTRAWIEDGGWRAYWFAIDVIKAVQPRFSREREGVESLDSALAIALGCSTSEVLSRPPIR